MALTFLISALRSFSYGDGASASSLGSWQDEPSPGRKTQQPAWSGRISLLLSGNSAELFQEGACFSSLLRQPFFSSGKMDATAGLRQTLPFFYCNA